MKFIFPIFSLLLLSLCLSYCEASFLSNSVPFERIFGYKKVFLTLNSHDQNLRFPVLFGLHHSGFLFKLTSKQLNRDKSNFFKDACFLKKNLDVKNEFIAYLDFRLVDTCTFSTEEEGLYEGTNLVLTVKNHELASKDRVWNIGIAPKLKLNKFCSGMTLASFAKRMTGICRNRHDKIKTNLKLFSDTGDHYYRVKTVLRDIPSKIEELQKKGVLSLKEHKSLLALIKKNKIMLKLLRTDVSAAATNYLKSKQDLQEQMAGRLNKGALFGQIEKEATFAKGRYHAALRNLHHVKSRILELIPDAENLIQKAFFAADEGKHKEVLEKLRINI